MFETETILSPCEQEESGDNVDFVNRVYREQGMPDNYLIFHSGMDDLSAVRLSDGKYVQINRENFEESKVYNSLAEWYTKLIRAEYAFRYGLVEN